ncbi:MAG: hypothetical protein R3332_03065 [Pseudohongiellaceae bacterium]|nr:hypothetical protein [Pseudohongiellaceae bacterium]
MSLMLKANAQVWQLWGQGENLEAVWQAGRLSRLMWFSLLFAREADKASIS